MAKFNSAEYTKLRDIAQKRQKRLSAAGYAAPIHIPTVKEIKAGIVSPGLALQELKNYLSGGSTVKAARQTGLVPDFKQFPELPKPKPITEAERIQRKKEQQHLYRQRKRIREKLSPEKQNRYNAYLKALETISKAWKSKGRNIGIDLQSMSPAEAQAFVEYLDFRFSQGDFSQHYVIDESFINTPETQLIIIHTFYRGMWFVQNNTVVLHVVIVLVNTHFNSHHLTTVA